MEQGKNIYDWIDEHRLWHLCLEDLKNMKKGDIIDVVIFDRNMEEYGIWGKIPEKISHEAKEFFRFNKHQIEYKDGFEWELKLRWGNFIHPIHFNLENLSTNWRWSEPDEKGNICISNEIVSEYGIPNNRESFNINVKNLHSRTRIGWRGPIMFWKDVEKIKTRVFWSRKCL